MILRPAIAIAATMLSLPAHASAEDESADEDPADIAVTEQSLLSQEQYWPYIVALVEPVALPGGEPIEARTRGILIRVTRERRARIDFGLKGVQLVPIGKTNVVSEANGIRRGRLHKFGANFTAWVGNQLQDPASAEPRPFAYRSVETKPAVLCVFADPAAAGFAAIASALAPLGPRYGLVSVLFPQGGAPDARVRAKLRALDWTVPFVEEESAEAFTSVQLGDEKTTPALLLQTNEGRVLFESAWSPDGVARLTPALDTAFGR